MTRWTVDTALLLLLAFLGVHGFIIATHSQRPPITDEIYYVEKAAYIAEHRRLAPADPRSMAVEEGRAWGNSDWRPQGYPVLLAVAGAGAFDDPGGTLRIRAGMLQFLGVAAVLVALYVAVREKLPLPARYAGVVVLGVPPWVFNVVNDFGPDPFTLTCVGVSTLLFAAYATGRGSSRSLAAGASAIAFTLLLRPEMIVMPPLMIGGALLVRRLYGRIAVADVVAGMIPFIAILGLQIGYRTWFTGRVGIYGGHNIYNRGIQDWITTWFGSEKEGIDFAFAISEARPASVPARAYGSPREKALVEERVRKILARGRYTADDDAFFAALARERERRYPLKMLLLRVWHTFHLWFNTETNSPLLETLKSVPRTLRRPLLGGLVVLRMTAVIFSAFAVWKTVGRVRAGVPEPLDALVLLTLLYALSRTLLMGFILNWTQHRYVSSAWPMVLACAAIGIGELARLRSTTS